MSKLKREKQIKYFDEVIRLHYEEGMGENKISRILPIGHTTASNWIAKFAAENKISTARMKVTKPQVPTRQVEEHDKKSLEKKIKELESQVMFERLRADFYDEMINVAEAKFNIKIRKKAGAKR